MFRKITTVAALALSAAIAVPVSAVAAEPAKKGIAVADAVQVKATIESVDTKSRTVTLKGEDGKSFTMQAGPEVKNLAKLKPGQVVTATYVTALAARIAAPGEPMKGPVAGVAKPEGKKGVAVGQQVRTRVKVDAVDTAKNTITVAGEKGPKTLTVKNPDLQKALQNVKAGDEIELIYTEALALSLSPEGAAPAKK